MSGEIFNGQEIHIKRIAEYVRQTYLKHKSKKWIKYAQSLRDEPFKPYSKETLVNLKKAYKTLSKAYVYALSIAYLQSGDDDEESFLNSLKIKMNLINKDINDSLKILPDEIKFWEKDDDDDWF